MLLYYIVLYYVMLYYIILYMILYYIILYYYIVLKSCVPGAKSCVPGASPTDDLLRRPTDDHLHLQCTSKSYVKKLYLQDLCQKCIIYIYYII